MKSFKETEMEKFNNLFREFENKKVVLYGIGRATQNIISANTKMNIIGLLDKEKAGNMIYGLPILKLEEAERLADIIIINTADVYWPIIYQRIKDVNLPIYLKNGYLAKEYFSEFDKEEIMNLGKSYIQEKIINIINAHIPQISSGEVIYNDYHSWGFCIWGPVIWGYVAWLYEISKQDGCKELLFLSRDGYLLKKNFDYYCNLHDFKDITSKYVVSGRRITLATKNVDVKDIYDYVKYDFRGTFRELLSLRFDLEISKEEKFADETICLPRDIDRVREYILLYWEQIREIIQNENMGYVEYLNKLKIGNEYGIVDTGFSGYIPDSLESILGKKSRGFYFFYGNKDGSNPYGKKINPCFQMSSDCLGERCNLRKNVFLIESVFTAPTGTAVKVIDEKIICRENKRNFEINDEINRGIEDFINVMKTVPRMNVTEMKGICLFVDKLFGYINRHSFLDKNLQEKLIWDDAWSGNITN